MSSFADWEFLLHGDSQDFRNLTTEFGTAYFNVYGGVDDWNDCPNDDFRMTTLYCEGETDADTALQIGYELVSLWNGAYKLFWQYYRKARIHELRYKGESMAMVAPRGTTAMLDRPSFPAQRIQAELEQARKGRPHFHLMHLATENWDVYCILKYLDMEPGWASYYKLMEAVEHFADKKSINLGIDRKKKGTTRDYFTNTANNFGFAGFDSRHGFKEQVKKNNTPALTLDEGYKFVTDIARLYLRQTHSVKC